MLHQIVEQLAVNISVKTVFQAPTIEGLAGAVDASQQNQQSVMTRHNNEGAELPLSYGQYRVWFVEQLKGRTNEHNMPFAVQIDGEFNVAAFEKALNLVCNRHEIFRTRFYAVDGQPVQTVEPEFEFKVEYHQTVTDAQTEQLSHEHDSRVFQLDSLPLISCLVIRQAENQYMLRFNQHHIISDGWSQGCSTMN